MRLHPPGKALGALGPLLLAGAMAAPPDAPVADAAMRGDVEAVRTLLSQGADVNAAQGDGMTALHWAAEHGHAELARMLVYAGADPDAGTRIGSYTPLHIASRGGHADVVGTLLDAGADAHAATTNSGAVPLHLAAESGDSATVALLLDHGADPDARDGAWGQTPLIFAAAHDRAAALRVLIRHGADPDLAAHARDAAELAEADRAAERRLEEILDELRKKEGGGSDWRPTPSQVQAALDAAREIQRSWPDVQERWKEQEEKEKAEAEEEARRQEEDAEEDAEETGYGEAGGAGEGAGAGAGAGEGEEAGAGAGEGAAGEAQEEEEEEEDEPRPMSYAEMVGHWGGLTPLLHAVRQGHRDAVVALLDGGAGIDRRSAGDGTSPLLMAAVNGQFDVAMLLVERGADPNLANEAGTTPLYAALERQWAPKASYAHPTEHQQQETTYLELMEALLDAGADPNVRLEKHLWYMEYTFGVLRRSGVYTEGATPFWRAAFALDVDAMRLLKEHGADPTIPVKKPPERRRRSDDDEEDEEDPSGVPPVPVGGPDEYPIHAASGLGYGVSFAANAHRYVPNGWLPAVRFLVEECGADVNARDASAYTPLHNAAARGDNEMILYLVEHGANVDAVSRKGQTTADMANGPVERVQPYPETVKLLEELGSENNHNCVSC